VRSTRGLVPLAPNEKTDRTEANSVTEDQIEFTQALFGSSRPDSARAGRNSVHIEVATMKHPFPAIWAIAIALFLAACQSGPTKSPSEQSLSDARISLKSSDFNAALTNLEAAMKAGNDDPAALQAAVLRVALVTALADASKQMAEAYSAGARQPAARSGAFGRMRNDYYGIARTRLMDAMQSVMNQRSKLGGNTMTIEVTFPGFTGGTDPAVTKIKNGQWVEDPERVGAELMADRNALARILSALAGAGQDVNKGEQLFNTGKVEIDPRVYLIELSDSFLQTGGIFEVRGLNELDHLRTVHQVVKGNLDAAGKLLAAKPDKDLEVRTKKMQDQCEKMLKKLGG